MNGSFALSFRKERNPAPSDPAGSALSPYGGWLLSLTEGSLGYRNHSLALTEPTEDGYGGRLLSLSRYGKGRHSA